LAELGRTFSARYVVHPTLKKAEGGAIEASVLIVDAERGQPVGSKTVRGKPGEISPVEAQRVLLEASLATADLLLTALGGKGSVPQSGRPTPQGSQPVLVEAETLCRSWSLPAMRGALERACLATKNEPCDGRAWAMAARCYARLNLGIMLYPARFYRETALRAIVAADLARRFAPNAPDVLLAAGEALYANHRRAEAETLLAAIAKDPKCGPEALAVLANIQRKPFACPLGRSKDPATTLTQAVRYFAMYANRAAGNEKECERIFLELVNEDPQNLLLLEKAGGGPTHATAGMCEAFAELLPAVSEADPAGARIAGEALKELRAIAGAGVPENLQSRESAAQLRNALAAFLRSGGGAQLFAEDPVVRLLRVYGKFEAATVRLLIEQPQATGKPCALSLLDLVRFYDRNIIEGLGRIRDRYLYQGADEAGKRFMDELTRAFPADEAVQVFVGLFYKEGGRLFSPPTVTKYFNQAKSCWAYYTPERLTRAEWAITVEPPERAAKAFKVIADYDVFNAEIVATIINHLSELRQWDDAAELLDKFIKANSRSLWARTKRIVVERARTGRQISKADIVKLAADFRDHPDVDEFVADLYHSAGMMAEAEPALRKVLARDPGNSKAFYDLLELLRFQGKPEEADKLVGPFVTFHQDLTGNGALLNAARFYYNRREYDKAAPFMVGKWGGLDTWQGGTIIMMGDLRWARGDFQGAVAEYERCHTRYQDQAGPMQIGRIEALRGNWEEVNKQGDRICGENPAPLLGFWMKALCALHKGDLAEGEKQAFTGRVVLAHDPEAYQYLAAWRFHAGNFQGVTQACEEGRRYVRGGTDTELDMLDVKARLILNDAMGARPIIERMGLFFPYADATWVCLALWHLQRNDVAEARKTIELVRRCNPRSTLVQVTNGRILLAEGKKNEAIAELRYACDHLHFAWQGTEAHYYLGQALEAAGQTAEAKKAYQRLLALWSAGYWADKARAGMGK